MEGFSSNLQPVFNYGVSGSGYFGGEVYGILREGGNYHCYNVIGDCVFDLTSEQFGNEKLCYENNPVQSRDVHFAKEERKLRYEYLKSNLDELIK